MIRRLLAVCLLWPLSALAGHVERAAVTRSGNMYFLNLVVMVNVDHDAAYAMITDDDHLSQLTGVIISSSRLSSGPTQYRRRIVTRPCILFFCVTAVAVEDVRPSAGQAFTTSLVPSLSDFSAGGAFWSVSQAGTGRSRVDVDARLQPKFWIPPLIGPWLIRRKLVQIGRQITTHMELAAVHG